MFQCFWGDLPKFGWFSRLLIFFPVFGIDRANLLSEAAKKRKDLNQLIQNLEADASEHLDGGEVDSLVPIVTCQIFTFWEFLSQQLRKIYFHLQCV